jgi:hypothetical protein
LPTHRRRRETIPDPLTTQVLAATTVPNDKPIELVTRKPIADGSHPHTLPRR